ncbi:P-loop containing nucleoside triphosphate hydrolase protein [Microthyrium microscopicum]|uniref:Pre-mRNA-splicing factor n=1 Tax=Microthyrium microscopicum TaxID=703497 RepID=A0A6A6UM75_9PEZI|nr:P-loop containing nucleoside triphosphate hydrolase protein [Microthyrium microscopicum]
MPPRKKNSQGNGTVPVMASKDTQLSSQLNSRPTVQDLQGDNHYAEVARKHWLKTKKPAKVKPQVVKDEIWDHLEKDGFAYGSLLILETLQILERYLWPGYDEDSSNHHVLLLAIIVNVKHRESLPAWTHFESRPAEFSSFFRRVLSMSVDTTLSQKIRTHFICFIIAAFESLDNGLVRKECAPLVSISIWQNLHSDGAREELFNSHLRLRKVWRAATRRFEQADAPAKAKLKFERAWLYSLMIDFLNRMYSTAGGDVGKDNALYCERFVELLIDLQSQLPTRRYVNTLILDLHVLPAIKLSPAYNDASGLLQDLYFLLEHYTRFPIEDHEEKQMSISEYHDAHCKNLAKLQRISFKNFESKLKILSLSNYGSLGQRDELEGHLEPLSDAELISLCQHLGMRTDFPSSSDVVQDRSFFLEALIFTYEGRPTFQESARDLTISPTEKILYEPGFLRSDDYNGSHPLALPKLNLQYLTVGDFLWRSFILHRCEAFYGIRKDAEEAIKRMQPRSSAGITRFDGSSRMAVHIQAPAVVDIAPPRVGEIVPSQVRAEIIIDVRRMAFNVRREWESLRPHDVVFLLAVHPLEKSLGNGSIENQNPADKMGLRCLRVAEVVEVQDEKGKPLRDNRPQDEDDEVRKPRQLRIILRLDPHAFKNDQDRKDKNKPDVYQSMNLLVRRRSRENNFKSILESIKRLTLSDVPTPSWLRDVFLGYGDPSTANYRRMSNRLKSIDFRDTFLNWQHLVESFPGRVLEPNEAESSSFDPPYVLEYVEPEPAEEDDRPSKKRRKVEDKKTEEAVETLKVSTYKPLNMGPYPMDATKLNSVRFTPTQVEAISSGTQPGLTVIVGPPGTGKTDVATQIISNIYHNFPAQRTLLVAHSNQALNQLFQKIIALDIDERHLLRLGHGEEELETDASYSKYGRVESFLERGSIYLAEVARLAASIEAPGAHGSSCETADYFNQVYIKPAWTKYWDSIRSDDVDVKQIIETFPFLQYFSNTPQPLFPSELSRSAALDIVQGCHRHINKMFTELADVRPFEILQRGRDKQNYLLIREARIIAMTSTHAAMRRQEIADLGFHYDNVIMEEAAQITEIENFIPIALQKPKDGELPLQRVVLVGDHLQNAPIIQNLAFRQYANLEQSLFLRLIRLGAPSITLDQQGRARPSIAELYHWRYPTLTTLPSVLQSPEFQVANPGFRYDYQFIEVEDYQGKGESEPTPHFIQNLGEAEYSVALYMYMRLLGYPAHKISILTMYAGQRALIRDVLNHRCKGNPFFGLPRHVSTVDKFQGEQNDYIILSLTRTSRPGYIRDLRRLTVALSRARLGLYVLGRRAVFESVYELQPAFEKLFARPIQLAIVTGEVLPCNRGIDDEVDSTPIVSVQHLGQYVHEMTKAKVAHIKAGEQQLPELQADKGADDSEDDDGVLEDDAGVLDDDDEDVKIE